MCRWDSPFGMHPVYRRMHLGFPVAAGPACVTALPAFVSIVDHPAVPSAWIPPCPDAANDRPVLGHDLLALPIRNARANQSPARLLRATFNRGILYAGPEC